MECVEGVDEGGGGSGGRCCSISYSSLTMTSAKRRDADCCSRLYSCELMTRGHLVHQHAGFAFGICGSCELGRR